MAVLLIRDNMPATEKFTCNRKYIYLISTVAALGGLLFGFDLAIISGTIRFLREHFRLNELQVGWAVGCINLGAAAGALAGGRLAETIGRKKLLLICAFLFALTGAGSGWSGAFAGFVAFRMLGGMAIGMAALVCPMYIAEMAPSHLRGRLVAFYQLAITVGILMAYLSNFFLLDTGENNWRWMLSSQSVPAFLFFAGLFWVPESPRWLVGKQRKQEAMQVLSLIGGAAYAEKEHAAIAGSFSAETRGSIRQLFRKDVLYIVCIGIIIAVFSQAVGQNSIFSYAPEIFRLAGMAEDTAFLQSALLGVINLVFTFVAIGTIDRMGRRKLLLYGAAALCLDALAIAWAFHAGLPGTWTLSFVLLFIVIYSATLGPVTWVALSEIFPNRIRGNAMALSTLALWIANFFTVASFPLMKTSFGLPGTFLVHAGICFIYFLFVQFTIPETKGRSLEEIERILVRK